MPQISQVIRDGLGHKDSTVYENAVIWTSEGAPGKQSFFGIRRFGCYSDIAWFRVLRLIAYIDALRVPFLLGFLSVIRESHSWQRLCLWLLLDILYGIGSVLFRLRVSTVDLARAVECLAPNKVMRTHMSSATYWLDVLSLFGMLWIPTGWCGLVCFNLLRLWRLMASADDLYELHESRFETGSPARSVLTLLCNMVVMIHWLACGWFGSMALNSKDLVDDLRSHERWFGGELHWMYIISFSVGARMLAGWGWPMALEDTFSKEERVFHAIAGPFSGVCAAYVFSQIIVITTSVSSAQRHLDYLADVAANVASLRLPESLEKRVLQYHTFLSVHNVLKNTSFGDSISADLNKEVRLYLFEPIITASFFQDLSAQDAIKIVMAFKEDAYAPDEYIINKGDIGKEVYFIMKGSVKILDQEDTLLAVKDSGEYFGEVGLLSDTERTASVQSKSYSLVAVLTRDEVFSTFEAEPASKKRLYNGLRRSLLGHDPSPVPRFPKLSNIVPSSTLFTCCGHQGSEMGRRQSTTYNAQGEEEEDHLDIWGLQGDGERTPLLSARDSGQESGTRGNGVSLLTNWFWKSSHNEPRTAG